MPRNKVIINSEKKKRRIPAGLRMGNPSINIVLDPEAKNTVIPSTERNPDVTIMLDPESDLGVEQAHAINMGLAKGVIKTTGRPGVIEIVNHSGWLDSLSQTMYGMKKSDAAAQSICVCCKKPVHLEEPAKGKAELIWVTEYRISALCEKCQP
jgi:hypothetical protein